MNAEIGIIGGTGVYDPKLLKGAEEVKVYTPYGMTSDQIVVGELGGRRVAFLARHGKKHEIPPHNLNFRANIWAMNELGVTRIIAPQAVGSLKEDYKPGDIVICEQFIDRTHGRASTFYESGKVCHISVAEPFCPELRKVAIDACKSLGTTHHETGTYVCVNGPRFSTKAESGLFQSWGADVIGMTLVPECVLAREMEICYVSLATVTDYDVWRGTHVSLEEILTTMRRNIEKIRKLIPEIIKKTPRTRKCSCENARENAIL